MKFCSHAIFRIRSQCLESILRQVELETEVEVDKANPREIILSSNLQEILLSGVPLYPIK